MTSPTPQWVEQAKVNAQTIESEIESLSSGHRDWHNQRQFHEFWPHVKRISQMFKELKPLLKDDRTRLWEWFGSICQEAKNDQQATHEARFAHSRQLANEILFAVDSCGSYPYSVVFSYGIEELKISSQKLKEAGQMLSRHKHEMLGEHKQECFKRIQEMQAEHDVWWAQFRSERSHRHEDFQSRVRANLERNYERHKKAAAALESCRVSADTLRDKIASAWNDDWRSDAEGWLSELEDKIADIESSIERIEKWIEEDQAKLR